MRIETQTPEEAFEAFAQIMDAGFSPKAVKFSAKLVVQSTSLTVKDSPEDFESYREWVVDHIACSDDAMDFFEDRDIDVEKELL